MFASAAILKQIKLFLRYISDLLLEKKHIL